MMRILIYTLCINICSKEVLSASSIKKYVGSTGARTVVAAACGVLQAAVQQLQSVAVAPQ